MSPVAVDRGAPAAISNRRYKSAPASTLPTPPATSVSAFSPFTKDLEYSSNICTHKGTPSLISSDWVDTPQRRPSPWHDLAHSLSTTSLPRQSSSVYSTSIPTSGSSSPPSPGLSTSQALREWEARLSHPTSIFSRHTLIPPRSPSIKSDQSPGLVPKLAPERDKEGHIEYKLKLIDPSPERFERLVTQMLWRLKQGKSEALYEIGLADDGTVIGLSRSDMDASLRTLELMAGEVGATVLILKEIVLTTPTPSPAYVDWNRSASARQPSPAGWVIPHDNFSPYGCRQNGVKIKEKKKTSGRCVKRRDRRADRHQDPSMERPGSAGPRDREKPIIFDMTTVDGDSSDEDETDINLISGPQSLRSDDDGDVPPFHLEMDDSTSVPQVERHPGDREDGWKRHCRRRRGQNQPTTPKDRAERDVRSLAKAKKSTARREARRLDLLRGDGTSPLPLPSTINPHAPARPSSLRLAAPAPAEQMSEDATQQSDDNVLHDLLIAPLDSLSLSFADVRTIRPSSPSSSSSSTEYAPTWVSNDDISTEVILRGDEKICVEALVVRKVAVDEGEEDWDWGGDDDAWGLSADVEDSPIRVENTMRSSGWTNDRDGTGVFWGDGPIGDTAGGEGEDPWGFM